MKIKVYAPNGKELKIHSEKLTECPLCHESSILEKDNENEESVDCICLNCRLMFTSFSLRNFIKLRGFVKGMNYDS